MPDDVTPFARLLLDYMWAQRPPLNFSGLARQIGVSKATVSNWASGKTAPNRGTLELIALKTGIPLSALYEALGMLVSPHEPLDVWNYIAERVASSGEYSAEEQEKILDTVRKLQAEYEQQSASPGPGRPAPGASSVVENMRPEPGHEDRPGRDALSSSGLVAESRGGYAAR